MRTLRAFAVAVVGLALVSSTALGQRVIELGIDAQATFGLDEPNVTIVEIPVGNFRVGFEMVPRVSLEPSLSLTSIRLDDHPDTPQVDEARTTTIWNVGLGMLWHFREMRSGAYVRPFIDLFGVSGSGDSDTQFAAGVGVGYKIPVADGRVAWRLEANFAHAFESDTREESNQIGLRAGLSFFTR